MKTNKWVGTWAYRMLSRVTKLLQKQSLFLILEIINLRSHRIRTHVRVRVHVHAVSVHSPGIANTRMKVRLVGDKIAVHRGLAWMAACSFTSFLRQRRKVHRVRSRSIDEVEVSVVVRVNLASFADQFLAPHFLWAWFWLEIRVDGILMSWICQLMASRRQRLGQAIRARSCLCREGKRMERGRGERTWICWGLGFGMMQAGSED